MRILITGSRRWSDQDAVERAIWRELDQAGLRHATIVHGGARGADTCAAGAAAVLHLDVEAHPADWSTCAPTCEHAARTDPHGVAYCPLAGPRRNQAMVDLGADVCLAFPLGESRGTWDCVKRAQTAGIPVRISVPPMAGAR